MSFPTYEHYKDSGVEWLGEVPAHWEVIRLVNLFQQMAEEGADDLPILSVSIHSGVSDKEMNEEEMDRKVTRSDDRAKYKRVMPGDLVYNMMRAWQGGFGAVTIAGMVSPAYVVARPTRSFITEFIEQQLRTPNAVEEMRRHSQGVTDFRLRLYWDEFKTLQVVLPPIEDQRRIMGELNGETSKIDALITEQRTLIDLLKEKRQAVISHAVTKGLDAGVAMKDSGVEWLGEVPAHWDVRPVKSIASIGNGATPNRDRPDYWSDGNYPWLSSTVVNQDIVTEATEFVTQVALDECHLPKIMPPAILVGITGQGKTRGMVAILGFEATINQHIACVKPIDEACVGFVRRYFDMAYERMRFESDGAGSTKGAITCEQIANMKMPLPPIAEQKNIGDYIDREMNAIDALTAEAQTTIALLQERRSALISAAVTGKIDVRQAA
ncbi:restriction endonuclease subunit S [Sphaerotilus sp.]|uniref:restriction endonuclease subunit S n=1 Tax=Sphaerotilus sp. TaxID=2093942 RepID=UPI0025DDD637|nr:restriction endonuclease subunit S [Sphaerotilus sp.]